MVITSSYDEPITLPNKVELYKVTLVKGGERMIVQIGNTVIDILHGYNRSGKEEPVAIIDIYPYNSEKPTRALVRDDKSLLLNR